MPHAVNTMIAWLLLIITMAHALDLQALRDATLTPSHPKNPNNMQAYATELRLDLAPLCGNGRLNTVDDYTAYYEALGSNHTNRSLGVLFYVNEVCDDGNRLDGDGCAADCASMDALTTPCPLDTTGLGLTTDETYSFVALMDDGTLLVVTSASRVLLADASNLTTLRVVSTQDLGGVTSGFQDDGIVWLYAASNGTIWKLDASHDWQPKFAIRLPGLFVGDYGVWLRASPSVVIMVTSSLQVVDVTRLLVRGCASPPNPLRRLVQVLVASSDISNYDVLIDLQFVDDSMLGILVPITRSTDLVCDAQPISRLDSLFNNSFMWADLFVYSTWARTSVMISDNHRLRFMADANAFYESDPLATPLGIYFQMASARQSLGYTQTKGISDPAILKAVTDKGKPICGSDARCILDVPLCYDVLAANPYAMPQKKTLYEAFVASASAIPTGSLSDASTWMQIATTAKLDCSGLLPPGQVLTHPATGALWVVRGAQLFEIGRRGMQLLDGHTCMPSYSAACPAGQWSPPRLACRSCSDNNNNDTSPAWSQQCFGNGRRLLANTKKQAISLIVVSQRLATPSEAVQFLAVVDSGQISCMQDTAGGVWTYAYACLIVDMTDAPRTLRVLQTMVNVSVTEYLAPPHVVWLKVGFNDNNNNNNNDASGALSTPAIVGIGVGGVIVVVLVGLVFTSLFHTHRYSSVVNHYDALNQHR